MLTTQQKPTCLHKHEHRENSIVNCVCYQKLCKFLAYLLLDGTLPEVILYLIGQVHMFGNSDNGRS